MAVKRSPNQRATNRRSPAPTGSRNKKPSNPNRGAGAPDAARWPMSVVEHEMTKRKHRKQKKAMPATGPTKPHKKMPNFKRGK